MTDVPSALPPAATPPRPAYQKYALNVRPSAIDGLGVFAAETIAAARKIGEIRGATPIIRAGRTRA